MGNLAKLFEKIGCQDGVVQDAKDDVLLAQEITQPSALPSLPKKNKRGEPSEVLGGRWDERLFKAINDDLDMKTVSSFSIVRR